MNRAPAEDIRQLVYRYCRALDRLDGALLASVFHPDAELDMGAIYRGGVAGFVEVALGFMGSMVATRHEVSNILIVFDGDDEPAKAQAESYVTAWHRLDTADGPAELIVRARYLTRFSRRDADRGAADGHDSGWRIAFQTEILDWGHQALTSTLWHDGNDALAKGARGADDPSYAVLAELGRIARPPVL